jgi:hypothetical protein
MEETFMNTEIQVPGKRMDLISRFTELYGRPPQVEVQAPGRVN